MKVGVLMLAAGRSRRFGSDKRGARLDSGESLLGASIASVRNSGLPLLVCLGPCDDDLDNALAGDGVAVATCPDAGQGMGHTLSNGVQQCPLDWDGLLIALADMPWIQPDSYRAIARRLTRDTIVVPQYGDQQGNPVGFGRRFYGLLASITGDQGARNLVRAQPEAVRRLQLDDPGLCRDVDTTRAIRCAPDNPRR